MTRYSGRAMGAHQQIDRVARRRLAELLGDENQQFPAFRDIVRFEGKNGPDGIKIKSPAQNEPWHYINPLGDKHEEFLELLMLHYDGLVTALKNQNMERAAFEASWLAHAAVDGMTPAHHFPYETEMEKIRGEDRHTRTTLIKKMVFKGETRRHTARNMYKVYGPRGLYTAHHIFEFGVMMLMRPLRLTDARPKEKEIQQVASLGPAKYFINSAREVAGFRLYDNYLENGWTPSLSNKVRHQLAPAIVKTVTLLWYQACKQAEIA